MKDRAIGNAAVILAIPGALFGALLGWLLSRVFGMSQDWTYRLGSSLGAACFYLVATAFLYRAVRVTTPSGRKVPVSPVCVLISIGLSTAGSLLGLYIGCEEGIEQIFLSTFAGAGGLLLGVIPVSIHEIFVIRRML